MNRLSDSRRSLRSKNKIFAPLTLALSLTLVAPILSSCKGLRFSEEESYGLRLVTMDIKPEEHGLLNGQLFSKRPAQVEIRVAGEFKVSCSASYAGRSSLDAYRKSYDLNFCDKSYNKRSAYRLSAQAIDKTMVRSLLGYEIFKASGLEVPSAELATAYINKKYQGVYIFMENVDKEFYKAHDLEIQQLYKARYGNASFGKDWASRPQEAFSYDGRGEDDFVLIQEIYKILWNEPNDEVFAEEITKFFDVESYLSYAAAAAHMNHWDGFDNNYFLAFDRGRNKIFTTPWDLDRIWEKPLEFQVEDLLRRNHLLDRLLKIPAFKSIFLQKLTAISGEYTADRVVERMKTFEELSRKAYSEDPILSRYQSTAFVELEANIRAWDIKVREYLGRNPIM